MHRSRGKVECIQGGRHFEKEAGGFEKMDVIKMNKENIEEILKRLGSEDVPADVQKIAEETARDFSEKQTRQPRHYVLWENIMRSRITKLAAAAVVITVVLIGMHFIGNPLGSSVTFAQVIQPILDANTAVLDIVLGNEEDNVPVIHDMVMGSRIRRTMSNMPEVVSIIDLEKSRILTLTISTKEAVYIDLKGLPSIPNYMDRLRNIIRKLQDSPDFSVEELGEQDMAGQELIGFHAANPKLDITIWADPRTALPVRIEHAEGQMKVICKNIHFDASMDESLFSMEVPEGYKLKQTEIDLKGATEQDFIEGLRIRAQVFGDGTFPEGVAVEDYLKEAPAFGKKMGELGLSEKEQNELGMKLAKHLLFIRFFKGEGEWHYAGKGVKLGDADVPIFWYRPEGAENYRVIYGDLSVKDVAPENLPK
jgi:outer membrane lipoprotein-sorting protein